MKTKILEDKKKDLFLVDVTTIKIEDGFNVRTDYGDIEWLKESIRENGVIQALRCRKTNGEYVLIDGHRRHRACMMLVEEGVQVRVPVMMCGKSTSPEQRIIEMMTLNEGKRLNPVEEAEGINRLLNYGLSDSEISKKIGKTLSHVSSMKTLHNLPTRIKNMVRDEKITATLLISLMRETKDVDELEKLIASGQNVLNNEIDELEKASGESSKQKKITKKHIDMAKKKTNSVSALKKAFAFAKKSKLIVREDNNELHVFAKKIISGELSKEDLIWMLFEEKTKKEPVRNISVKDRPFSPATID